nr:SpaA isopeptide-forming pilin-related protein [uncultured Cellulosilyticum sp.]
MQHGTIKHFKRRWVYLVVLAMIFQLMTGMGISAEATGKIFVGGMEVEVVDISLKDEHNQLIGTAENPITTNSTISVAYQFKLDKCKEISTNQAIKVKLPEVLKLIKDENIVLRVEDEEQNIKEVGICEFKAETGEGTIRFNEELKAYDTATLGFKIGVKIDESGIQEGGTKRVAFEVGTKEIGVNLTFKGDDEGDKEETPPTIEKSVEQVNEAAGTITWKVIVKAGNKGLEGAIVKESFNCDELTFKGVEKDDEAYNDYEKPIEVDGRTIIRIQVPKLNANQQCIFRVITEINDKVYDVENSSKEIKNTASLVDRTECNLTGEDATASTTIVVEWIKKSAKLVETIQNGEYIKKINWTVTVNSNHRNIAGWNFMDYLPQGTELMKETVKLNNKTVKLDYDSNSTGKISYKDKNNNMQTLTYQGKMTYKFGPQEDHNTYVFTYATKIVDKQSLDIGKYIEYINYAEFTGLGTGIDETVHKYYDCASGKVSINATKKFGSYNKANHTITWNVIVNANNVELTKARMVDKIPAGLALDQNSISVEGTKIGTAETAIPHTSLKASYDENKLKEGILECTISGQLTKECMIQFDTVVTDPNVYGTNNPKTTYKNNVDVYTQDGESEKEMHTTAYAVVPIKSTVINKQIGKYDYASGTATWLIVINESWLSIKNLVITDVIPKGQQYVEGSFKILRGKFTYDETKQQYSNGKQSLDSVTNYASKQPEIINVAEGQQLTYSCEGTPLETIDAIYTVVLKTKINPEVIYKPGEKAKISNKATITSPTLVEGGVSSEAEKTLNNSFVLKSGKQASIDEPIEWKIVINPNQVAITDVVITDVISKALKLDTDSIKLYKVAITSTGAIDEENREAVAFDAKNVTYRADTNTFTFSFGKDITIHECYELVFNTDVVTIKSEADYTNTVSLKGATLEKVEEATSEPVKTQFSDSWGKVTKKKGTVKIRKIDAETEKALVGAEFILSDGKVSFVAETNEEGVALFEDIPLNKEYTVTESKAPSGYKQLMGALDKITLTHAETREITVENTLIKNGLEFKKLDQEGRAVEGAVFKLYSSKDESKNWTKTSDKDGLVTFTQIPLGKYLLKEIAAPTGYMLSNTIYEVEIKKEAPASIIVQGDSTLTQVSEIRNESIRGSIKVIKVNESQKNLKGAMISLLNSDYQTIRTLETDENGIAYFENIPYGTYYIQETQAPSGYLLIEGLHEIQIQEKDEQELILVNKTKPKDDDKPADKDKDKDDGTTTTTHEEEKGDIEYNEYKEDNKPITPQEADIALEENKENYSAADQSVKEYASMNDAPGYAACIVSDDEMLPKTGSHVRIPLEMLFGGIFIGLGSGISFYRRKKKQ